MDTRVQQQRAMPPPAGPLKKEPPQILYGKLSNFIVDKKVWYFQVLSNFTCMAMGPMQGAPYWYYIICILLGYSF